MELHLGRSFADLLFHAILSIAHRKHLVDQPMNGNAVKTHSALLAMLAKAASQLLIVIWAVLLILSFPSSLPAQSVSSISTPPPGLIASNPTASPGGTSQNGWVVRDATTGRIFHQQLVPITVPTVRWESKPVTTTVMQPQWITQVVPETQVTYQSQTQMVLQPYWQGWWNPMRQPTLAYRHVPVTTWQPATSTANRVVTSQQMVPVQRTIQVPHPVTETQTVQQLVQTEIPQTPRNPSAFGTPPASVSSVASVSPVPSTGITANQQPLLGRIPLLAGRPAWQSPNWQSPAFQSPAWQNNDWQATQSIPSAPTGTWVASSSNQSSMASSSGLRPVARAMQSVLPPAYDAPMQSASRASGSWDVMQSGLRPTVLR